MNAIPSAASTLRGKEGADILRLSHTLATAWAYVETCRARHRFRRALQRMSIDDPHLVDDIGLTRWQAEAEIAKRFWER